MRIVVIHGKTIIESIENGTNPTALHSPILISRLTPVFRALKKSDRNSQWHLHRR